jgi:hypothetical protein
MSAACPACGKEFSATCPLCRERRFRLSPLKILGNFPWATHHPVWRDERMAEMFCERCGLVIRPEMTMRELVGPCSGGASPEAVLP